MKLNRWMRVAAAAVACGLALTMPLAASAAALPDTVGSPAELEMQNAGYLALNDDDLYIEIPEDESSVTEYLYVLYAEDGYNTISWSSSNISVATVDNGAVTAWSQGTAIITAKSDTGDVGYCKVTVTKDKASQLNRSYVYMEIEYNNPNPRYQLYLQSAGNYDSVYQWRTSNPAVATVDKNGVVTAYSEGVATIYANTYRGVTLNCTVTVENSIGKVTLNESRLYLNSIGAQGQLVADIAVEHPEQVPLTWTSNNPAAATVDGNGLVTAVGDGMALITATSPDGHSDECKVYTGTVGVQKEQEAKQFFGLGGWFQDLFD